MTVGPGDALFGRDGTGGDPAAPGHDDGIGPLPGFELPVVPLPTIGPDGSISGLEGLDDGMGAEDPGHAGDPDSDPDPDAADSEAELDLEAGPGPDLGPGVDDGFVFDDGPAFEDARDR